jgi:hypothetical protein
MRGLSFSSSPSSDAGIRVTPPGPARDDGLGRVRFWLEQPPDGRGVRRQHHVRRPGGAEDPTPLDTRNNYPNVLQGLLRRLDPAWRVIGQTDVGTIVVFVSGFEVISDPWRELVSFYRRTSAARVKYQLVWDVLDS